MMNRILLLFLCLITISFSFAQTGKVDSLKKILLTAKSDTVKVNILNDLSYRVIDVDTLLSLKYAEQAYSKAKTAGFYKGMAEAYYNMAYAYSMQYKRDVAENHYLKGIDLSLKYNLPAELAIGYMDYATLLKVQGKFKPALQINLKAVKIYEQLRDSAHLASIYTNIGNCYVNLNLFDLAIVSHIKSLKINQQRGNNVGIARTYNNIAIVYERNGNFEKAYENYLRMLKPALSSGKKSLLAAANCNIGSALTNLKKPDKALPYLSKALKQEEELGNKPRIALTLNNLAAVYNDLHQYKKALDASNYGMRVAREADDTESLAYAYLTAGTALAGLKDYKAAQVYMDTAYVKAKIENRAGLLLSFYHEASKLYKATGNYKKAQEFTEQLSILKDSTYNAEKHAQIAALQEQYDSQRKDRLLAENSLADAQNKIQIENKNRLLIIFSLVMISLASIIGLVMRNMKLQQYKLQTEKALAASSAEQELLNEKLRISSELHDNIGSQLTFIHSSIQNMRRTPDTEGDIALQETEEMAVNTIRDLRQTVWFINNSTFSLEEFTIRLREYVKPYRSSDHAKLTINNTAPDDVLLSAVTATHLFRIVQEAINNTIKYASASNIAIEINQNHTGNLTIKINDDGKGFDTSEQSAGFGLRNMHARAQQTGGYLEVKSVMNKGTSVQVSVPV